MRLQACSVHVVACLVVALGWLCGAAAVVWGRSACVGGGCEGGPVGTSSYVLSIILAVICNDVKHSTSSPWQAVCDHHGDDGV